MKQKWLVTRREEIPWLVFHPRQAELGLSGVKWCDTANRETCSTVEASIGKVFLCVAKRPESVSALTW